MLLFVLASGFGAQAASTDKNKKGVIDAADLYAKNCAICHGDKGDGNTRAQSGLRPPPRDFTTVQAAMELHRERMIKSVTEGRPGTGMMAHKGRLSGPEIEVLVDYVRTKFMRTPELQSVESAGGKKIYEKNCAVCHGDKGNTAVWARGGLNPPPRDFTTVDAQRILTRDRMINSVTKGRPGTGMVSFESKFSAEEIALVVDYIRGNLMHRGAEPASQPSTGITARGAGKPAGMTDPHANRMSQAGLPAPGGHVIDVDMSLPMPNNLKGDEAWGRTFFMNNCFTCHGVKGDGDGPRAHFNIPRPRNFTSDDSRRILNRVRLFNSITNGRVGTVMPAWRQVLNQQQIASLAEFVFTAFIQPASANESKNSSKKKAP